MRAALGTVGRQGGIGRGRSCRRQCACRVGRREAAAGVLIGLTGLSAAGDAAAAAAAPPPRQAAAADAPCDARLDPQLAAALLGSVYGAVQQLRVVPEEQLQRERFRLQEQEFKYYAAANRSRMPPLPQLEDDSGGLSNRAYFNFVSYVLWKVVARHLATPEQRAAFCGMAGQLLLERVAPGPLADARAAAAAAPGGRAPAAAVVRAAEQLLALMQAAGYVCGWQLVWGSQPGDWPADWVASQAQLVGVEQLLADGGTAPLPAGSVFQVKLKQPADIEGSVALRAEEEGFWGRAASSCLAALLAAAGYPGAAADEFFSQDYWSGPSSAAGKLLLLLGDPLQQVDVPWTPTTLVQNWALP